MAQDKMNRGLLNLLKGGVIAAFLLMMALGLSSAPAYAQFSCTASSSVSVWANAGSSNWNTAGNWNPSGVPNSASTSACILNGTATTVTQDISATVDDLTLNTGNALDISNGLTLAVAGTSISNAGTITLNGGAGSNGFINIGNNVTLSGGGTVTLATATGGGDAIIQQSVGGLTLTNKDNTIQGNGAIGWNGLALVNQSGGTIDATTASGQITTLGLNGGAITNAGLMEATSGVLQIQNAVANTGNITANGGTVQLFTGSSITGGTLNTKGGGTMETVAGNSTTLSGVTISSGSTYTASNNATTVLLGTITNKGNIQLNGGAGSNGLINVGNNVTLSGGGTVNLTTATGSGDAIIEQSGGSLTLTNADNTIQGNGGIGWNGLALVNQSGGTIDATTAGGQINTLTLNGGGAITNQGLMEATTGTLQIQNAVTNTGGNITANGGTVQLFTGSSITGGTLNTKGGGTMETVAGNSTTLSGVTISSGSTYTASNNATTVLLGTITNKGNIQLNGGGTTDGFININSNVTLSGGGTVTLATAGGSGSAYIQQSGGSFTLTNADNTIQGNGVIGNGGLAVSNAGTIDANVSGQSLLLNGGGGITNTNLLETTNSGVLQIQNAVTNTGNITANGGTVQLFTGSSITGGTLNTKGGGTMETVAGNSTTLSGVTISSGSAYTASNNATTVLLGTITNKGNIQLNGGAGSNGFINIGNNVTLQGGGTVTLATAGGGGSAYIQQSGGSLTLTNADNTIQGNGVIGNGGLALVNGGTLLANVTGQTMLVNGSGSLTNNGTFEVTAGSTLHTQNGAFTNFSGSTLTGGTYDANGTIQIDQLGSTGGEIVTNAANIILDGSSSGAALISDSAGKNALSNLATNQGSFTIKNGGNANFTTAGDLANSGTVTVGSGTTLTLGSGGSSSYTQSAGTTQGTGTIAGIVAINGGTILPGAAHAPGTLTINGSYNQTGGTFSELIGSASNFGVLNVTGGNLTLGSAAQLGISLLNGFNPVGDTFTIMNDSGGLVSGTFENAPSGGFAMDGVNWTIAYNSNDVVLNGQSLVGGLVTAKWNTASGNWTTATEWSCTPGPSTCVPNNGGGNTYAAVLNSSGNTLTLSTDEKVNTLALTAGTLDIALGGRLVLTNQPNGITDIPNGAGLSIEGSSNGLADLTSVEGTLMLDNGIRTDVTPSGGTLTVSSTGSLTVSGSSTVLGVTGGISNSGTVTAQGGGAITTSGNYAQTSGSTTISSGSTLTATTAYTQSAGVTDVNGTLTTFDYTQNGGSTTVAGTLTATHNYTLNNGTAVIATGGVLHASNGYLQNGGSTTVNGTLNNTTGINGVVMAGGTMQVNNALNTDNYRQTSGVTTIAHGGTLTATTAYSQSSGTTDVDGTLISPTVTLNGGTLTGTGTVQGSVSNIGGMVEGGDDPLDGTLTVTGNYTQGMSGMLMADINGGTAGNPTTGWDVLDIGGSASLGGMLDISLNNSFLPTNGEMFQILDATGGLGGTTFASLTGSTSFGSGGSWDVLYGADTVTLEAAYTKSATPEPASLLLFGTGLLGLAWLTHRKLAAQRS